MVARAESLRAAFLGEGAEHVLREAQRRHSSCEEYAKAALRDLGCEVQLKMLWKGEGHNLTYD